MTESTIGVLTVRFIQTGSQAYRVDLEGQNVGERHGPFAPPYNPAIWQAIMQALEPGFVLAKADKTTQAALKFLGNLASLPRTAGTALANALLADDGVRLGFDVALGRAEALRRPLPVEMRFGAGCDALAALPWELLYYRDRFLLADTSIALSRYPEGAIPPTPALGELPLRVLLVLSEPVGASPIFPERAREELLHGLHTLDEAGAVVVDLLRPPTFSTLVEAVTNGGYHMVVFYGHGGYDPDSGGLLLFEDEFGGPALIKASELGAALRNTDVRLVLLGACQSATTADLSGTGNLTGLNIWSGTAPALVRAGVPLAIGMQVSMRVDAAQAFIRQFALSLAAGKPVIEAVGDARKPIIRGAYSEMWYAPALYGRPTGDYRLFDPQGSLPANTADLRAEMKEARGEIERLEKAISDLRRLEQPQEIAYLRQARVRFAQARAEVARRTPGGYAAIVSPLYGVPTNPIFVGRAQELHDVAQAFAGGHPVVIWGVGGIGKSALAAEVAHRQSWRFPAGVLWLDCRSGPAFDSLLNQIGAFAGIEAIDRVEPDKKEMTVKWALAGLDARCLLVWDNTEEVWDERAVRRFVESLPANCQALLTTRENPERAMWPTVELGPLSDQAMHDLFHRLATAAGVKAGSRADLDAIPRILDWLQGHPLALVLVVPLAMKRGLQRVWADLQARPLRGIEAAFELSYERLTDLQRRVFTRLSVYTIPFDWPAAQALLPDQAGVDEALDVLVQRALVEFDGARYTFHALLRQYAYARLQEGEDARVIHRLAAEYLQAKITNPTAEDKLEETDQWERAEAWEAFAQSAIALVGSIDRHGYWLEIEARLARASAATHVRLLDPLDLRVGLLRARAAIARRRHHTTQAISLLAEVVTAYEHTANDQALAISYVHLGDAYCDKGSWEQAAAAYHQSLDIFRRRGDHRYVAEVYRCLGWLSDQREQQDQAIAFYKRSTALCQCVADDDGLAASYRGLGDTYARMQEWDLSEDFYEKSLAIGEHLADMDSIGATLNNWALVCERKREWDRAIEFHIRSLAIIERRGDIQSIAGQYSNLGLAYAGKEQWDQAVTFLQNALLAFKRLGDLFGMAMTYNNLGVVHARKGEPNQAIEFHHRCLVTLKRTGSTGSPAFYRNMASVYADQGEWEQAFSFYEKARMMYKCQDNIRGMARTYDDLGNVCVRKGEIDRAVTFYEKSLAMHRHSGALHAMALAYSKLGFLYQALGNTTQAAEHAARAYLLFTRLRTQEAQEVAHLLIEILGSVEAANAYLAQIERQDKA